MSKTIMRPNAYRNSSRPKSPSLSEIWDKLNVRIFLTAILLCLCLLPAGADDRKFSPSQRVLHRRRLARTLQSVEKGLLGYKRFIVGHCLPHLGDQLASADDVNFKKLESFANNPDCRHELCNPCKGRFDKIQKLLTDRKNLLTPLQIIEEELLTHKHDMVSCCLERGVPKPPLSSSHLEKLKVGDRIEVNYKGEGKLFPATYKGEDTKGNPDYISVIYDDSPDETLGVRSSFVHPLMGEKLASDADDVNFKNLAAFARDFNRVNAPRCRSCHEGFEDIRKLLKKRDKLIPSSSNRPNRRLAERLQGL